MTIRILLETGDVLLLETGDAALLELEVEATTYTWVDQGFGNSRLEVRRHALPTAADRLSRHRPGLVRYPNVYIMSDNTLRTTPPPESTNVSKVVLGGHSTDTLTDAELTLLVDGGYLTTS